MVRTGAFFSMLLLYQSVCWASNTSMYVVASLGAGRYCLVLITMVKRAVSATFVLSYASGSVSTSFCSLHSRLSVDLTIYSSCSSKYIMCTLGIFCRAGGFSGRAFDCFDQCSAIVHDAEQNRAGSSLRVKTIERQELLLYQTRQSQTIFFGFFFFQGFFFSVGSLSSRTTTAAA